MTQTGKSRISVRMTFGIAAVVGGLAAWAGDGSAQLGAGPISFPVSEGTSMAIAVSPDRTSIVIDLQGGLWVVPYAGGEAVRITDEYGDARQPSWSPDGRTIAFQSYRDGTWRIWTVGADGSGATPVTTGPFDDREPHWSPDGSQIAFSSDRSGNYDVWVLDLASRQVRQITRDPGNDFFPAWSPDGRRIAFVSNRQGAPGVYSVGLDGTETLVTAATGNIGSPSWSPDGRVMFSVIEGGRARLMLNGAMLAEGEDYFPFRAQWVSPDEFLYPADGRIKRRSIARGTLDSVPFTATLVVQRPEYARKQRDYGAGAANRALGIVRPVISPDGSTLAFAALGDIWRMPLGGTPVRVTDDAFVDTDPAWSPDGTRVAYSSDRSGSMDLWIRDLRSGTDRQLTSLPDAEMAAAWSPDGASLVFVSNNNYEQGEVFVVAAGGGQPRRIAERSFGVGYPSWTGDGRFVLISALKAYSSRYREGMNYYSVIPVSGGPPSLVIPSEHMPIGKRAADGPAVSPDGSRIAYVSNAFLYVQPIGADGRTSGPARQITNELSDAISWAGSDRILYMATDRLKLVTVADGSTRDVPVALTWTRKVPSGRILVHAGTLVDLRQPDGRSNVDIVIQGNRIASIVAHDAALHTGTVVDASGQSVMPGLIEGHGHQLKEHGDLFGRVHLAYGITAFRNVGAPPYEAVEDKEAIEAGRRLGPRVFTTGYLLDGARPYYPMASTAPNEAVVDMEIERARRLDYDMFKMYVRLPDLLQRRAIEGAHRIGIPTSSHEIYPAALSGGDNVEHTAATSRRGYSTKQSGLGRAYEDVVLIIARSGMVITPTLGLGGFRVAAAADPSIVDDPRMRLLQPAWVAAQARGGRAGGAPAARPESWNTVLKLQRGGARVQAGIDSPLTPFAVALHTELQDYVGAGMTPYEALRTATVTPAIAMGAGADLGTIEAGKLADMVILDGNPLVDIRNTMRVRKVIKNGELLTLEQLLDVPAARTATPTASLR